MRLSRTIAYAVHATVYLAGSEPGVSIPCSEMARAGKMPERFLLQVLRNLVNHGVLRSTRGVEGGYTLARAPNEITLREIVEAFDNPLDPHVPALEGQSPEVRRRLLERLEIVSQAARSELQKLSMADLLSNGP
jgi:Rrf2 family transcriptional regulator, cysteine metabolism repressor